MAALPWVSGVDWQTPQQRGVAGHLTRHASEVHLAGLRLTLYTRWSPSPTLVLHIRLLARLLTDYYQAKQREQEQRQNAYMHAIYETGSRLTHDVKNLLQSLGSLCSAVEQSNETDADDLRRLLQRQLPQVNQRLQRTVDKLDRRLDSTLELSPALAWWSALQQRYAHEDVRFEADTLPDKVVVPTDLFDRVAENLLQNALQKRHADPALRVDARLAFENGPVLSVCDTGQRLSDALAHSLFATPVPSLQGLGVGLYQAARQANALGYRLALSSNETGRVCFSLLGSQSVEPSTSTPTAAPTYGS